MCFKLQMGAKRVLTGLVKTSAAAKQHLKMIKTNMSLNAIYSEWLVVVLQLRKLIQIIKIKKNSPL